VGIGAADRQTPINSSQLAERCAVAPVLLLLLLVLLGCCVAW
jgi:hypothetical protein